MEQSAKLSAKEQALLDQFRDTVKDVLQPKHDDHYLLKWLKAREWDLKKSEKMLRDSMEWRKKYGADDILSWEPPEVIKTYYPGGFCGVDKEGYPIWYELLGRVDLRGMFFAASVKDMIRYRIHLSEYMARVLFPECSKKAGRRIDQCVFVFDMDGIGIKHLWKPAIDSYLELLALVEANYPESLRSAFVLNAPSIFPIAYNLAKPFLAEYTKSKIQVLGGNWKAHLLKYIPADQLPVYWGGTARDPDGDPYCKSKICLGGTIPEKYYLKNLAANVDMSQFTTVTVNRGSSHQVDMVVDKPESIIRWNFWTDSNDIGFGVFRRTAESRQKVDDMVEVVGNTRVNSHMVPEEGSVPCDTTGTFVVRFDNTYSWVNTKRVSYLVEVLTPDAATELQHTAESTDL